jgi:hypothetical protein
MTKTRNKLNKKNKTIKSNKSTKSSGGTDLEQKYSLASIDEGSELGGFKHSNTILGVLGIGSLLYYVYYKKNIHT